MIRKKREERSFTLVGSRERTLSLSTALPLSCQVRVEEKVKKQHGDTVVETQ